MGVFLRFIVSIVEMFMIIDETRLDEFRRTCLAPEAILDQLERSHRLLARVSVGAGKSHLADELLLDLRTYERYDLVIYTTRSWDILEERAVLRGTATPPVKYLLVQPRPRDRCGDLADEWARLERVGCSAYAKRTLCEDCPRHGAATEPCTWPEQFRQLREYQLIFLTEQNFIINRSLLMMIKARTGAKRILLIMDEAQLISACFELQLSPGDLRNFSAVLARQAPRSKDPARTRHCMSEIAFLLHADSRDLARHQFKVPSSLNIEAYDIQEIGITKHGHRFRYLGYDLVQLNWCKSSEIWKEPNGTIRFIARPYLGSDLLVLSANLHADYVAHRLGIGRIDSPFEDVIVRHSGTRIINLRARLGTAGFFSGNANQILGTFAVAILRNIVEGRTTLLVSQKKTKHSCAEYLAARLAGWGFTVQFECANYGGLPVAPDPSVIPIIHYGMRGVNTFCAYQAVYALNSFYVSNEDLERSAQEFVPTHERASFKVYSGAHRLRRAEVDAACGHDRRRREALADVYLRQMEVDAAVQALGRARFATEPREVVFFEMHDLSPEVGPCVDVMTLIALRDALGIPDASEIDEALEIHRVRELRQKGASVEEIATALDVSPRTASRRLNAPERAKNPYIEYVLGFLAWSGQPTEARS